MKKQQICIRIEKVVLDKFKEMAGEDGEGYQKLINKALVEWLEAGSFEGLLKNDIDSIKKDIEIIKNKLDK